MLVIDIPDILEVKNHIPIKFEPRKLKIYFTVEFLTTSKKFALKTKSTLESLKTEICSRFEIQCKHFTFSEDFDIEDIKSDHNIEIYPTTFLEAEQRCKEAEMFVNLNCKFRDIGKTRMVFDCFTEEEIIEAMNSFPSIFNKQKLEIVMERNIGIRADCLFQFIDDINFTEKLLEYGVDPNENNHYGYNISHSRMSEDMRKLYLEYDLDYKLGENTGAYFEEFKQLDF